METSCHGKMDMIAVISPQFCSRYQVHLTIVRKPIALANAKYLITDEKGYHIFDIKEKLWSIHGRHVLVDTEDNPIANLKKKLFSAHKNWQAFKGGSSNLLFTTKNVSSIHSRIEVEVYLASNKKQVSWDFKVVGSWLERPLLVYNKDFKPIAQVHMEKKQRGSSIVGKDTFELSVYPKVDYAFVVALLVILCELKEDRDD